MRKKLLFLILSAIFPAICAFAQEGNAVKLQGTIVDDATGKPMTNCVVQIVGRPMWAISDAKGGFVIPNIKPGAYTYEVTYLGFQSQRATITLSATSAPVTIRMREISLALEKVVVTAIQKRTGSSSVIDRTAIQHIQPKSVADALQLIPGNLTKNPQMASAGQAYVREISYNVNNSASMGIFLDGAAFSNDANMQLISLPWKGNLINTNENDFLEPKQNVSGRGVDLRSITPGSVESIEVVRGIASAEYGNLTSGAMIIKTRAGRTPLEIKGSADANSKMAFVGKGFDLGGNRGAVNIAADYSDSYADLRRKFSGYERITANVGYSNTFMRETRPLTFNFRASYYSNINNVRQDPSVTSNEYIKNENYGLRFTLGGNWRADMLLLSTVEYNLSLNTSWQKDKKRQQISLSTGITPTGTSYTSGEYETFYLGSTYYSDYMVDGHPVDASAKLKLNKLIQFASGGYNTFSVGGEWNHSRNNGKGLVFDPHYPPSTNLRNRSFSSIPAMNTLSGYAENKLHLPLGGMAFTLTAGVRATHLKLDESVAKRNNISVIEPRINAEYRLLGPDNNSLFQDLTLVGGFGMMSKMPTMSYLYPDNAYLDITSLAHLDNNNNPPVHNFAVITTDVVESMNINLKPSQSKKWEIGMFATIGKVRFNATYFNEHFRNEYLMQQAPYVQSYRRYNESELAKAENFSYRNGNVYYYNTGSPTEKTLSFEEKQMFRTYTKVDNNGKTFKEGVEYTLILPEWKALRTSLTLDGSYLRIERGTTLPLFGGVTGVGGSEDYPYRPIYPAGIGSTTNTSNSQSMTNQKQRFNTNFRFITHIPQLRMVISTTAQVVWLDTDRNLTSNLQGDQVYYWSLLPGSTTQYAWMVDPVEFMDYAGNTHKWTSDMRSNPEYAPMIARQIAAGHFDKEKYPIQVSLNFRVTKELGDVAEISAIANNFLNTYKKYKYVSTSGYRLLYDPMYFGAEVMIKF